jgi:polar amino acid transport system substrate-binding protein
LLLALLGLAPVARAQSLLPLIEPGKLTWGTSASFPPYESVESGKVVGFDADMMNDLAARLHIEAAVVQMEFKGLIPALLGARIDAIASGMYINPERSQVVDFIPYMRVGNQLMVAKGNPLQVKQLIDLCGHRIAAGVGTVYEKEAQQLAADCQQEGKPALTILSVATGALAIKDGRADAMILATPTIASLIHESPEAFETAGEIFDKNTLFGIGISKDKPALKEAVATVFKAANADGTIAALIKKYGLPPDSAL